MKNDDMFNVGSDIRDMELAAAKYRESAAAHAGAARTQRRIFLTTGLIVLALVVVFLATAAWFANNRRVTGDGLETNAEKELLKPGDYEIFKAHDTKGSSFDRYMFGDIEAVSMNAYDAVINQNLYTAVYLRIPVESKNLGDDNVTGIRYSIDCDENAAWVDSSADDTIPRYLSSIVRVKCYAFPSVDEGAEAAGNTAEYFYTAAQAAFDSMDIGQQYVSVTDDGAVYSTKQLSFTIPKYNETNHTGYKAETLSDGSYRTYLYVEINYSAPLVSQYLGLKNGHIELGQPVNVDQFYQDLIQMELSAVQTEE